MGRASIKVARDITALVAQGYSLNDPMVMALRLEDSTGFDHAVGVLIPNLTPRLLDQINEVRSGKKATVSSAAGLARVARGRETARLADAGQIDPFDIVSGRYGRAQSLQKFLTSRASDPFASTTNMFNNDPFKGALSIAAVGAAFKGAFGKLKGVPKSEQEMKLGMQFGPPVAAAGGLLKSLAGPAAKKLAIAGGVALGGYALSKVFDTQPTAQSINTLEGSPTTMGKNYMGYGPGLDFGDVLQVVLPKFLEPAGLGGTRKKRSKSQILSKRAMKKIRDVKKYKKQLAKAATSLGFSLHQTGLYQRKKFYGKRRC